MLVILGVLIALQVINWNGERKARKDERQILERLHEDLHAAVDASLGITHAQDDEAVDDSRPLRIRTLPQAPQPGGDSN